ncbi:YlbE-like family protein [Bacillus carboniphilus]|uniref:YlbE-like family protein n=1 Tax=Bacillus carboniphilus TaxID=86663 RepID=A0ABY9JW74_9BACI|nr:YlbE-like family protein [Bacillus carboniphilus]WLR43647.1 YlbE-like family protein [Bacillus carboniphilus]
MRKDVLDYIYENPDIIRYLRENPHWYRVINRNPQSLEQLQIEMMNAYEKTIPHMVSNFSNSVEMAKMMMGMLSSFSLKD